MTHSYILIITDNPVNLVVSQILETQIDQICIIGSNEHNQSNVPNIHWVDETAAFYQPWRNSLLTLEGNIYHYDYLFLLHEKKESHFIRQSLLTDINGSIDINKETFQHKIYNNIFSIDSTFENDPGGKEFTFNKIYQIMRSLIKIPSAQPMLFYLAA